MQQQQQHSLLSQASWGRLEMLLLLFFHKDMLLFFFCINSEYGWYRNVVFTDTSSSPVYKAFHEYQESNFIIFHQ
jgi:hypothetical protein